NDFVPDVSQSDRGPAKSFECVVSAVREGLGSYGVLPLENSSTGAISEVYDLLGKYGCYIVGEQTVHVEHALLGTQDATLDTICQVHSHEQGFFQCREFLKAYPQWEHVQQLNTAISAKLVASAADPTMAAIASARNAQLYGLKVLAEKINTNTNNYTRFIVVAAKPQLGAACNKISVVFTIPNVEGSLYRALSVFASSNLNLVKLESRPIPEKNWEYRFFADFTGNLLSPQLPDVVRQLISETLSFRILGNYRVSQV
ncbi:MAG: prephenate dehydratase domain-containing protein, partial [Oscillospiraceae bacterium]|nr:prephenate dehydratase domain-containing protein [Oscillospiraceae bacterium]